MGSDFLRVLGILATLMTIVGGAAFIYAYYLVSLNKNQLQSLRDDRDDLEKRVKRLEDEQKEKDAIALAKDVTITALTTKINVLEGIVTHDEGINKLIEVVEKHDANVDIHYAEYMRKNMELVELATRLLELHEEAELRYASQ